MRTVGKSEALVLLGRAVGEKGTDYVYTNERGHRAGTGEECTYFHGTKPGCIVGHVLSYIGLQRADLVMRDEGAGIRTDFNGGTGINQEDFREHLEGCNVTFTYEAMNILVDAQSRQDSGVDWGNVLSEIINLDDE